jgi:predicted transcriptional regulator
MSAKKPGSASASKKNSMINESFLNNRETCLEFLKVFKEAQCGLQADGEAVKPIIRAIEELGSALNGGIGRGMGDYRAAYELLIPLNHIAHEEFVRLYRKVQLNRNDYVHQGASVRSFASQASKLANLVSKELMNYISKPLVKDLMVETVIVAKPWHTLRKVRHLMLAHGFTAIPCFVKANEYSGWRLITDYNLLSYSTKEGDLANTCEIAFNKNLVKLEVPLEAEPETLAVELSFSSALPALVFRKVDTIQELVGIISPADIL